VAEGGSGGQAVDARTATPDVFVSYASQDAAVANTIVQSLETKGLRCWMAPRDVRPGMVYAEAIVGAINEAKALVLALSAGAMASSHVGREVERAAAKKKHIIAFRIDAAPLSPELEYFLSNSQWIDVPTLGMPAALAKLAEAVGQRSTRANAGDPRVPARKSKRSQPAILAAMGLAVGASLVLGIHFWTSKPHAQAPAAVASGLGANAPTSVPISDKSIAVLPFADMSEKKDQEYFADGTAEEILDLLAKIPGLHVPARTSSFYFKGKSADIPTIARRLMVAYVLEGSVRKTGNRVRITVQLVRADNGYRLWSETYDRKLDDIFQIQDEIAASVVNGLKVSVLGGMIPRATPVANHDAYLLYLQAKEIRRGNSLDSSRRAVEYLHEALKLDPEFSQGWVTLATFLAADYNLFDVEPHDEARAMIYSALDRARRLDPDLLSIHLVLGRVLYEVDWSWQAADAELNQAIELEPGNSEAHRLAGYLATTYGRFDEAIKHSEKAIELDPLQPWNYIARGYAAYRSGRLAQAEANFRTALDLAPGSGKFQCLLGAVLIARGQRESALAEMKKESSPRYRHVGMALALDALGQRNESDKELQIAEQQFGDEMGYWIAMVYAARHDSDRAFAWLDRAFNVYGEGMTWVKGDPLLGSLVEDPRYKALLQKMRLPE
jgi:TolB-like protein/tetratricopeptide (TPR) repeat protein